MKCYIVGVGESSCYVGYDYEYHVFTKEEEAENYFDKMVKEKLAEGEYTEEEIKEMKEDSSQTFFGDLDDEWCVRIDEGIMGE